MSWLVLLSGLPFAIVGGFFLAAGRFLFRNDRLWKRNGSCAPSLQLWFEVPALRFAVPIAAVGFMLIGAALVALAAVLTIVALRWPQRLQ